MTKLKKNCRYKWNDFFAVWSRETHGRMFSMSLKPSGVLQQEAVLVCVLLSIWRALSFVQVMWTRLWSTLFSAPSVSSSSSEPMLVSRSIEFLSLTSCAYRHIRHTFSKTPANHNTYDVQLKHLLARSVILFWRKRLAQMCTSGEKL